MSTPLIGIERQPSEPSQPQEHRRKCRHVLHGVFSSRPRGSGLGLHCRPLLQRLHQPRCIHQSCPLLL
jgi:hypothetical protein